MDAARLAALELKVAAQADRARVGDASGATSAGVWWANQTRMVQRDAHRKIRLAKALASPKAGGHGLNPHGMGLALAEYIRRYPTDHLPHAGGVSATVVVMMTLETLMGGLKAAQLDTGTPISPGQARKLASEAGIIPVVLDGDSQPLDVGREKRFHTKSQRVAMLVRGLTCATRGCEHHTLAHHDDYQLTRHPDGTITFTRRE